MRTIEQLEDELGPRKDYVFYAPDINILREWAIVAGFNPLDIQRMSGIELTNLYHAGPMPQSDKPAPFDVHEWLIKVLEATNAPGFEVALTRRVARAEMQKEIAEGETTKRLIQETLEQLVPRQLVVTSPNGIAQLDGLRHYKTEQVIRSVWRGDNVMMIGPAGCGKTTIGEHTARALNLPFYITSTINETHELTGFVNGHGAYHSTPFRNAFEFGGVWVADEIDAWDAAALLAANAALANGYANFPDRAQPIRRHDAFRMVATANTYGNGASRVYVGRNELDAASLDRFTFISVDYDLNIERMLANGNTQWLDHVWEIRKKVNDKKIRHVVSTRAIQRGSLALAGGETWEDVQEMYLFKGMSQSDREKVTT